jgi:hypothetical protein
MTKIEVGTKVQTTVSGSDAVITGIVRRTTKTGATCRVQWNGSNVSHKTDKSDLKVIG